MDNLPNISTFARQLLQQDQPLDNTQYEEYRMKLESALTTAERRTKLVGLIAVFAFAISLILMFVGGSRLVGAFDPWSKDATPLSVALGTIYVLAAVTWPLALATYFSRFRPRVRDIKDQIRDAHILALRGEISELRQQVANIARREEPR